MRLIKRPPPVFLLYVDLYTIIGTLKALNFGVVTMKDNRRKSVLDYVKSGGRVLINMNTGTRPHKPKKGKGSYQRIKKVKERESNE